LPPFVLYGSGDFHYLSGLWVSRAVSALKAGSELTLISFDNHPDWDIRPPRWACGGWINRALDLPAVRRVHVWGCGNFELAMPARLFANHGALRRGDLIVHPWAERQNESVQRRFSCIRRENWKYSFEQFASGLTGTNVYVTVDMDCLASDQASTNWESGLFTAEDVAWAIRQLRQRANLVAGDVCGAFSPPQYHGIFRRLAGWWDHPKLQQPPLEEARALNSAAIQVIWPALIG
jgi:hypothetical protein